MSSATEMKRLHANADRFNAKLLKCPFCGCAAVIDDEREFWVLGCLNRECREFVYGQATGYPASQIPAQIEKWNSRKEV